MTTSIRPFTASDRHGLIATINAVCAEGMMATRRFEPTPAWLHALDAPACLCHLLLVVEDNGQVVGWCRIFPKLEGDSAEIGLGLLPGYRDLGYGQELMSQAFSWVTGRGLAVSGS